ncbi:MAG: TPM domain-containing protein [Terracidiphilus sp.]|jgi:uncharacterized protein
MEDFRRVYSTVFRLLLAASVSISSVAALAERLEDLPQPTDYVSDYAHVLSPEAIARLDRICAQLDHSQANAQVAVVTIHTLNGADPAQFAISLFSKMKIGKKGTDRGILVFLAVDDHKRQIIVGYGLEGILPDGKVGDIGREMVPELRANDFDAAVILGVDEIAQIIAADAKVTLDEDTSPAPPVPARQELSLATKILQYLVIAFFLLVIPGFFVLRLLVGFGVFKRWGWMPYISSGGGSGGGDSGGGGGFLGGGDSGGGDSGFDGFGGGDTGGGGAGGDW